MARLVNYQGSIDDIQGLAGLAVDKPMRNWIDLDIDRAKLRIAELAQRFNHIEAFARVHEREDFRQAIAFMVGLNGHPETYVREFTIKLDQISEVEVIESLVRKALNGQAERNPELLLAALANIGANIIETHLKD